MPYFLDGNNLIGQARGRRRPSEEDRAALIAELAERLRRTKASVVLFFDGPGNRRTWLGGLSIREAAGSCADDQIVREIERSRAPREIVVVTADQALSRRVRDAGARVLVPKEFWRRFGPSSEPSGREDRAAVDVEEWVRYFEDEKNRS